jgi:hypothetical protein
VARLQLAKYVETEAESSENEEPDASNLGVIVAQTLAELRRNGSPEQAQSTILNALVEHLDVPRVVLLRATQSRRELAAVAGLGDDLDGIVKELRLSLPSARSAADPISLCYHTQRDYFFPDVFAPRVVSTLPQRYFEVMGSTSLALLGCSCKGYQPLVLLIDLEPPRQLPTSASVTQLAGVRAILARVAPQAGF